MVGHWLPADSEEQAAISGQPYTEYFGDRYWKAHVLLGAHRDCRWADVCRVIEALAEAGLYRIWLAARIEQSDQRSNGEEARRAYALVGELPIFLPARDFIPREPTLVTLVQESGIILSYGGRVVPAMQDGVLPALPADIRFEEVLLAAGGGLRWQEVVSAVDALQSRALEKFTLLSTNTLQAITARPLEVNGP